jgi:hypothetical protein
MKVISTEAVLSASVSTLGFALISKYAVFDGIATGCVTGVAVTVFLSSVVVVVPPLEEFLPIVVVGMVGAIVVGGIGLEVVTAMSLLAVRSDESVMIVLIVHCLFCHNDVLKENIASVRL